jgi:hypothetical protein
MDIKGVLEFLFGFCQDVDNVSEVPVVHGKLDVGLIGIHPSSDDEIKSVVVSEVNLYLTVE